MKKYIIKYADGREQNIMQAVHSSYNEAAQTLMDYLNANNDFLSLKDDDYLTPFDFKIEEVESAEVNEVITDYTSAVKAIKKKTYFHNNRIACNFKHTNALSALDKLFTIAQAWNMEDGFVPDFSDRKQDKWFPWFEYDEDAAKFVYTYAGYTTTFAPANFGSRLCFKTRIRAEQFAKQFINLYNEVFL